MNDNRISINDMTLAQIKGIKNELRDKIEKAVETVIKTFENIYDVGDIEICINRSVDENIIQMGYYKEVLSSVDYNIDIHFKKEIDL